MYSAIAIEKLRRKNLTNKNRNLNDLRREAEVDYAGQILRNNPDMTRSEALKIAASWARKDLPW
jgi:hypothetical protein